MKKNYSEPKIYTGGVDITKWSTLTKATQKKALLKDWYLYFSFKDPQTGLLKRQGNIKAGANRFKNRRDRLSVLKTLQRNLILLLEAGLNPYADNTDLIHKFLNKEPIEESPVLEKTPKEAPIEETPKQELPKTEKPRVDVSKIEITEPQKVITSVESAFELGLKIKEKVQNPNSYVKFKSHINIFKKWLATKSMLHSDINDITSKTVIQYLNATLERTSPRNRNNARTNLSSLFQTLVDNEIINENFVLKINVLRSKPVRNKTYTPQLQKEIYDHLRENDPLLLLYVQFISYNFLRPMEVCRLQVKDIDITDRKIYVKAKNKAVKIKIIPEILANQIPDLTTSNPDHLLFTPFGIGQEWSLPETNRRNYFTNKFKKVKQIFGLGKEYGLYSFRHTFITLLYRNLEKDFAPFEAKSRLMLITGHTTMTSLGKYLRDIDAELPKDYSHLLDAVNFNPK